MTNFNLFMTDLEKVLTKIIFKNFYIKHVILIGNSNFRIRI